ncbi:SH3 domain-containing protein [Mesobaculum littorinae]|uniref:SH3 domain-containing protein n=1 Tax=Mesobaculum littorinae TaxID=2486419 RepID=A0A438AFK8_9RHOB|nr:SH3 domain-containing protein [Mesobaculum littorinae]RVV97468.1 SH3 domain-containing protein [Mesobaculum littorinae]
MIRLTAMLIAGLYITMAVAGGDRPVDVAGVEVTRGGDIGGGLLGAANASEVDPATGEPKQDRLAIDDYDGAVARAIAASQSYERPAPARVAVVEPASAAPTQAEAAAAKDLWYVSGSNVNLRSGPSTSNPVVGRAAEGDRAEMLEQEGGWYRIRLETGKTAYIYGKFLDSRQG